MNCLFYCGVLFVVLTLVLLRLVALSHKTKPRNYNGFWVSLYISMGSRYFELVKFYR